MNKLLIVFLLYLCLSPQILAYQQKAQEIVQADQDIKEEFIFYYLLQDYNIVYAEVFQNYPGDLQEDQYYRLVEECVDGVGCFPAYGQDDKVESDTILALTSNNYLELNYIDQTLSVYQPGVDTPTYQTYFDTNNYELLPTDLTLDMFKNPQQYFQDLQNFQIFDGDFYYQDNYNYETEGEEIYQNQNQQQLEGEEYIYFEYIDDEEFYNNTDFQEIYNYYYQAPSQDIYEITTEEYLGYEPENGYFAYQYICNEDGDQCWQETNWKTQDLYIFYEQLQNQGLIVLDYIDNILIVYGPDYETKYIVHDIPFSLKGVLIEDLFDQNINAYIQNLETQGAIIEYGENNSWANEAIYEYMNPNYHDSDSWANEVLEDINNDFQIDKNNFGYYIYLAYNPQTNLIIEEITHELQEEDPSAGYYYTYEDCSIRIGEEEEEEKCETYYEWQTAEEQYLQDLQQQCLNQQCFIIDNTVNQFIVYNQGVVLYDSYEFDYISWSHLTSDSISEYSNTGVQSWTFTDKQIQEGAQCSGKEVKVRQQ